MGCKGNWVWTKDQCDDLRSHIDKGLSYSQAAAAINEKYFTNYSRCAATGQGYRLGLSSPVKIRPVPKPREPRRSPRIILKPQTNAEEIKLRCVEIIPRHLTLIDLEPDDCRYPYGDGPFTFCGLKSGEGSYCIEHSRLVMTPTRHISDAVTAARAIRMRRINFRRALLEAAL